MLGKQTTIHIRQIDISKFHLHTRSLLSSSGDPLRIAARPDYKQILRKVMTFYFKLFHFMFVIIREKKKLLPDRNKFLPFHYILP
jgi:hypothetical protein